jgi:tartrate dehydrogenase/decarboxylase/D-malate dehydrogenase
LSYRVALLPGDGVGPEVIAEARKALDALGLSLEWTELPWGSAYWREHGRMMPEDWEETLRAHDAVLMGAVGDPSVPDHLSLWGLILLIRQRLDLWANVRPARLLEGVPCPLAGRGPADVDMLFVRENTEGEYSGVGGRAHQGLGSEVGIETKSNASRYGYVLWDEVAEEVAADFPGVRYERVLVDALAARMVRNPESLDVVVGSNLFADILTDLAAAIQGGMGMAASANTAPGTDAPGLFEPVHGSAPDIAGQGIGNPAGAVWSAVLMLEHLGEPDAAETLMGALEDVCRDGPRTRDIGGQATTQEVGHAIAARVSERSR